MRRVYAWVYVLCFALGAISHVGDFVVGGWRPYRFGPVGLELFWSSLVVLDVAVMALMLLGRRRSGVLLALAIMVVDVSANAYALIELRMPQLYFSLLTQSMFLGFVGGSAPVLWSRRSDQS
jgi:hypothetical protein